MGRFSSIMEPECRGMSRAATLVRFLGLFLGVSITVLHTSIIMREAILSIGAANAVSGLPSWLGGARKCGKVLSCS
jgi:hypothetical protein